MLGRSQDLLLNVLACVLRTKITIYTPEDPGHQEDLDDRCHRNQDHQRDQDQVLGAPEVPGGNNVAGGAQGGREYLLQNCSGNDPRTVLRESYRLDNLAFG